MKQNSATRRLAEEAREKIATILMMEISDPRLDLVTVTGCEVSVDRSVCKVWVSADPDSYDEVLEGLQSAKGRIRSLLGRSLTWRVTPSSSSRSTAPLTRPSVLQRRSRTCRRLCPFRRTSLAILFPQKRRVLTPTSPMRSKQAMRTCNSTLM